jgi:hypothetical protein
MSSPRQQPTVALQQVDCDEVGGSPAGQRLEAPVLALAVDFPAPWIGVLGRVLEVDKGAGGLARVFQRDVGVEDAGVIELGNYLKPGRHRM